MGAALARAVNDWLAKEWLDRDPRLRASIVVPIQNAEMAAAEIERCAADRRFVQVLLPCLSDQPLGRRLHWPIYEAAQRHGLPVAIHAGSTYRHPVTPVGWPSTFTEDYVAQAQGFQTQLTSLVCEGVLSRFPDLTFVFAESGFTWLPSYLWRLTKYWHGLRMEIPWVDQPPADLIRAAGALHASAGRCATRQRRHPARHRPCRLGGAAALLDRLSALAVRRRRSVSRQAFLPRCAKNCYGTIRFKPTPASGRVLHEYRACPARAHGRHENAAGHRRLRHPSGAGQAVRHLALSAETLARACADLWPAAAPRLPERPGLPERPAGRGAAGLLARRWPPRQRPRPSCRSSISTPTMSSLA